MDRCREDRNIFPEVWSVPNVIPTSTSCQHCQRPERLFGGLQNNLFAPKGVVSNVGFTERFIMKRQKRDQSYPPTHNFINSPRVMVLSITTSPRLLLCPSSTQFSASHQLPPEIRWFNIKLKVSSICTPNPSHLPKESFQPRTGLFLRRVLENTVFSI